MEKLIHILPNLITDKDTTYIKDLVHDPDSLTKIIMRHFNSPVNFLGVIYSDQFSDDEGNALEILPGVNDSSSASEIAEAARLSENLKNGEQLASAIEELDARFNLEGKSATAILWTAGILNDLENKGIDTGMISSAFYATADTAKNDKTIGNMHSEVRRIVDGEKGLLGQVDDYLALAFISNQNVQESSNWYDFRTLQKFDMTPTMQINDKDDLFDALKDINNYNLAFNYIKTNYLSETSPKADGYCTDEGERNYKAFIIMSALASELYKDDAEFDNDNNIGLNLATEIIAYHDQFRRQHSLNPLTNGLEASEDAAGRIVSKLLGREISKETEETNNKESKSLFKYGTREQFVRAHIGALLAFVEPNLALCEDYINSVNAIAKKYDNRSYRGNREVEGTLSMIAEDIGVDLLNRKDKTPSQNLHDNLDMLHTSLENRFNMLNSISRIFNRVKRHQKTRLKLDENVYAETNGRDEAIFKPEHKEIIDQFFGLLYDRLEPQLKGDINATYRLPLNKKVAANTIKGLVEKDPSKYPTLARLTKNLRLAPKEVNYVLLEEKDPELFQYIYSSKASRDEKIEAVKNSENITEDEKEVIINSIKPNRVKPASKHDDESENVR